ncbi:cytochrome c oxidase subunit 2 [Flexibacter flexilis DSM 6793]|uniref:Cytochrome c oxidase subunit 2 n=2 Tax=Flexibacter flexilis TaxID=998 RepID=A0A1I1KQF8_9BACT|nr:cytochrome c oxidase subunit 2 [Flexibacter flexilis DSM 6793]
MNTTIFVLGGILVLAITFLLMRVQSLVDVLRGSNKKRAGLSNQLNAAALFVFLFVGFALFAWSYVSAREYFLPEAASIHGRKTDFLFWLTMGVTLVAFVGVHVLLFFFSFKYQYKEGARARFYPDNHKLELAWTVIPAIVLAMLVFSGWKVWSEITTYDPAKADVNLEIMGKQFNWLVRYPGKDGKLGKHNFRTIDATNQMGMDFTDASNEAVLDDFLPQEIHLPKGKSVLLKIRARDVLHSVFMPHFRVKMDAVPGMPTYFMFTPDKSTSDMRAETGNPEFNYELACTEICGNGHFGMRFKIVVDEPEEYEKWFASQESFVKKNPDLMALMPTKLKEKAQAMYPVAPPAPAAPAADSATAAAPAADSTVKAAASVLGN